MEKTNIRISNDSLKPFRISFQTSYILPPSERVFCTIRYKMIRENDKIKIYDAVKETIVVE